MTLWWIALRTCDCGHVFVCQILDLWLLQGSSEFLLSWVIVKVPRYKCGAIPQQPLQLHMIFCFSRHSCLYVRRICLPAQKVGFLHTSLWDVLEKNLASYTKSVVLSPEMNAHLGYLGLVRTHSLGHFRSAVKGGTTLFEVEQGTTIKCVDNTTPKGKKTSSATS